MKKVIQLIPFAFICFSTAYALVYFLFFENVSTVGHYLGVFVIIINGYLYRINFNIGILFTGVCLFLGTFMIVKFFYDSEYSQFSFFIKTGEQKIRISTPKFHWKILIFLFIYLLINGTFFLNELKKLLYSVRTIRR